MRNGALAVTVLLATVTLSSCSTSASVADRHVDRTNEGSETSSPSHEHSHSSHSHGSDGVVLQLDEVYAQSGISDLADESSKVVVGTVTGAEAAPQLANDLELEYTIYTIEVSESLAGNAEPGEDLRVAMISGAGGERAIVPGRPLPDMGDTAVFFLLAAPGLSDTYVLTSTGGGMMLFNGSGEITNDGGDSAALAEANVIGEIDEVVEVLCGAQCQETSP